MRVLHRELRYDLTNDEEERVDLATKEPELVTAMLARVDFYHRSAFLPERCVRSERCPDPVQCRGAGCHNEAACEAATGKYAGFWGPFIA